MNHDGEVQKFIENNIEELYMGLEILSMIIILSTTPKRVNNS